LEKLRNIEIKHDILQERLSDILFKKDCKIQQELMNKEKRKNSIYGFMENQVPF
jgi:hypothetical protein